MSSVRIAFASTDRERVDQHFGAAEAFAIYDVDADGARLVGIEAFIDTAQDGNENKLPGKIATLSGCAAVYCLAVGASAVKQLLGAGIQPMRVDEGTSIERLIDELRSEIATCTGGWLGRALKARQPSDRSRFDTMEAEGWSE